MSKCYFREIYSDQVTNRFSRYVKCLTGNACVRYYKLCSKALRIF